MANIRPAKERLAQDSPELFCAHCGHLKLAHESCLSIKVLGRHAPPDAVAIVVCAYRERGLPDPTITEQSVFCAATDCMCVKFVARPALPTEEEAVREQLRRATPAPKVKCETEEFRNAECEACGHARYLHDVGFPHPPVSERPPIVPGRCRYHFMDGPRGCQCSAFIERERRSRKR